MNAIIIKSKLVFISIKNLVAKKASAEEVGVKVFLSNLVCLAILIVGVSEEYRTASLLLYAVFCYAWTASGLVEVLKGLPFKAQIQGYLYALVSLAACVAAMYFSTIAYAALLLSTVVFTTLQVIAIMRGAKLVSGTMLVG